VIHKATCRSSGLSSFAARQIDQIDLADFGSAFAGIVVENLLRKDSQKKRRQ